MSPNYINKIIFVEELLDETTGEVIEPAEIWTNGRCYGSTGTSTNNGVTEERVIELINIAIKQAIDNNNNNTPDWVEYTDESMKNTWEEYVPNEDIIIPEDGNHEESEEDIIIPEDGNHEQLME